MKHSKQKTAAPGKTGNRCFLLAGQHPNPFETHYVRLRDWQSLINISEKRTCYRVRLSLHKVIYLQNLLCHIWLDLTPFFHCEK